MTSQKEELIERARADGGHDVHHLKTWPAPFAAVRARLKPWEFRRDDRPYKVGDTLWLAEWNPEVKDFTGQNEVRLVTYCLRGPQFGIPEGYVIMSMTDCPDALQPALDADALTKALAERDAWRETARGHREDAEQFNRERRSAELRASEAMAEVERVKERLQAIIDWADLALRNPQEFDSHGVRNLDGPIFDEARDCLRALSPRSDADAV